MAIVTPMVTHEATIKTLDGDDSKAASQHRASPVAGRRPAADDILRNHVLASVAAGLTVPWVDLLAFSGIQLNMVRRLSRLYGVPWAEDLGKSLVASLLGSYVQVSAARYVGSFLKVVPGVGSLAGILSSTILGGASTYAVGKVFSKHFESGGTLENFDAKRFRDLFADEFKAGRAVARKIQTDVVSGKFPRLVPLPGEPQRQADQEIDELDVDNKQLCVVGDCSHDHHDHHEHHDDQCGHCHSHDDADLDRYERSLTVGGGVLAVVGAGRLLISGAVLSNPLLFAITASATVVTGKDYFHGLWRSVTRQSGVNTDTLVGTAVLGSLVMGQGVTALAVVTTLNLGEYLQARVLRHTNREIRGLLEIEEQDVWVVTGGAKGEVEALRPLAEIRAGDVVALYEGRRIPVDGVVISGVGSVNQAPITGESVPALKNVGDEIYAGTILLHGAVRVEVSGVGNDTAVGRIIRLIATAQQQRPRIQTVGENFSKKVVPITFLLSGATFLLTGDPTRALTMLLIACPCAVGLSTPTAVSASIGNAARRGILIKGGNHLEALATCSAVVFDKTGTLTQGVPSVTRTISFSDSQTESDVLALAAKAEFHSTHPLALALTAHALDNDIALTPPDDFEQFIGLGIHAMWAGDSILVGNLRLMNKFNVDMPTDVLQQHAESADAGETVMLVAHQRQVIGLIGLRDTVRPEARIAIDGLRRLGVERMIMLTGDGREVAKMVAQEVGLAEWHAELMPEDKYDVIRQLQLRGRMVAMVGDGVNDAPSLTLADVGVALNTAGSDVAIEAADIALASNNLGSLLSTTHISRKTLAVIRENYALALGVNLSGLAVSAAGLLSPLAATLLHSASSIAVVVNSGRLIQYDPKSRDLP